MVIEPLEIRAATPTDLPQLLGIKPDDALHRERLDRQTRGDVTYLIAEVTGQPIMGYLLVKWRGDSRHSEFPMLEDLLVRPPFRSRGIGARLIGHAEILCRARGITRLGLGVNPTDNPRALALYERLGYKDAGEPPRYDVYAVTDETGQRRLYEDRWILLTKDPGGEEIPPAAGNE